MTEKLSRQNLAQEEAESQPDDVTDEESPKQDDDLTKQWRHKTTVQVQKKQQVIFN